MSKPTLEVKVFNRTNRDMRLKEARLEEGEWLNKPEDICNGQEGTFEAGIKCCCNDDIRGQVIWQSKKQHCDFSISFNKPVKGTTRFDVDCSDRFRFTISGDPLEEHARVDVWFYEQDFSKQSSKHYH